MATLTVDQFRDIIGQSQVKCELCGVFAHSLVAHLQVRHKMSPGQYKKDYPHAKLASPIVSELIRRLDRKAFSSDSLDPHVLLFQSAQVTGLKAFLTEAAGKLPPVDPKYATFIPEVNPHFEFEEDAKVMMYAVLCGKNLYVEGPTGCGKTEALLQLHAVMGRPVMRVNMHGDVTAATFIGDKAANPTQGTFFVPGILPTAMLAGIPLIVDEVDYTPPHIAATLHPALEENRKIFVPEAGQYFKGAPGFTILATGNTGGKGDNVGNYTGTEILNSAFLNRFPLKLKKTFLPKKKEVDMLFSKFPAAPVALVQSLVNACTEVRQAFVQGNLSVCFSTRTLIEFFTCLPVLGTELSLEAVFGNWLDADDFVLVSNFFDRCGIKLGKTK